MGYRKHSPEVEEIITQQTEGTTMIVKGREVKVDMQRRHLELIAQVINTIGGDHVDKETVAMMFADKLQRERVNANFDVQRFVTACVKEQ